MARKSTNVTHNPHLVKLPERLERNQHKSGVMWFTGLPGSGKSTITTNLERRLFAEGYQVSIIDNELVREGLSSDLGYSHEDRTENIRRAGEVAALLSRAGRIVLSGFIAPYRRDRETAREAAEEGFHEVFLNPGAEVCESRDSGRLYEQARAGSIPDFTGVSAPYEEPLSPELIIDTGVVSVAETIDLLVGYIDTEFRL